MPAVASFLIEPIWEQFQALIPVPPDSHPPRLDPLPLGRTIQPQTLNLSARSLREMAVFDAAIDL